jgi:hypothetical protein
LIRDWDTNPGFIENPVIRTLKASLEVPGYTINISKHLVYPVGKGLYSPFDR